MTYDDAVLYLIALSTNLSTGTTTVTRPREVQRALDVVLTARAAHQHCECRTMGCGHLDIRHAGAQGRCSFPGCLCQGWA
jgi:hypothetical protein